MARVLEVRRGDGTYVTSLEPRLLLEGLGLAVELLRDDTLLEIVRGAAAVGARRPPALAASRISAEQLAEVGEHLEAMRAASDDVEQLNRHDAAFHRAVVAATGNETLSTLLDGHLRPHPAGAGVARHGRDRQLRTGRSPSTRRSTTRWPPVTPRWPRPRR